MYVRVRTEDMSGRTRSAALTEAIARYARSPVCVIGNNAIVHDRLYDLPVAATSFLSGRFNESFEFSFPLNKEV